MEKTDMIRRGHSWRGWEPAELRKEAKRGNDQEVREVLEFIEDGRFRPILKAIHSFYVRLDVDERKEFWRRNPDLMRWVNVFGVAEHLNKATTHKPADVALVPE